MRRRAWRTPRKQDHLNQGAQQTYELCETACTEPAHVCTRQGTRAEKRSGHMPPSLT